MLIQYRSVVETAEHEDIRFLTKPFKKVLDVNAVALLAFCIVYTWMKSASLGIWGMLVWALVLIIIYPGAVLTDLFWIHYPLDFYWFVDMRIKKRKYVVHVVFIAMSWALTLWWLELEL
jgi:hypothetical protein